MPVNGFGISPGSTDMLPARTSRTAPLNGHAHSVGKPATWPGTELKQPRRNAAVMPRYMDALAEPLMKS